MLLLLLSMLLGSLPAPAGGDRLELENAWVRVWRTVRAPHDRTPRADHLPRVVVSVSYTHLRAHET